MHTASIEVLQTSEIGTPSRELGRTAPLPFLAVAAGLIVIAFMVPFEHSWYRPSYDESEDDERQEIGARQGMLERQIMLGALGLFGVANLLRSSDKTIRINGQLGVFSVLYLMWCAASCLWTEDLSISVRREIALACEVAAGLAIARRASPRQFVWLVYTCTLSWLCLGIFAELSQDTLKPWQMGYRFQGIFHANIMSVVCGLLILSSFYLSKSALSGKRLLQVTGAVAVAFLVLTGSRTAFGAVIVALASASIFTGSALKNYALVGFVVLSLVVAAFVVGVGVVDISSKSVSMGRVDNDVESLSSRVPLWQQLLDEFASKRLLAGYGYGAFWTPDHLIEVEQAQGWGPGYAHSSYIDLLLSVGAIGTFLFIVAMTAAFARATRLEAWHVASGFGFIAMVIACVLADGALETTFGSTSLMSFFGICAVSYTVLATPISQTARK